MRLCVRAGAHLRNFAGLGCLDYTLTGFSQLGRDRSHLEGDSEDVTYVKMKG